MRLTKTCLIVLLLATTAAAQDWYRGYGRGFNRVPPRFPTAASYDGAARHAACQSTPRFRLA